jgi:hypothetical protein
METVLTKVVAELSSQFGVVSREQLTAAGATPKQIDRLLAKGLLIRIRPSVYAVVGMPDTWERGLLAVILAAGDNTFASHSSSARLWEYALLPESFNSYEILLLTERRPRFPGVRVHRTTRIAVDDVAVRSGIPCTSFERTLCDCSTGLSVTQLGRVLDDGLRRGVASLARLKDCAERLESGPGRHMSAIRALLAARDATYNPGGSRAELNVLDVIRGADLPEPEQQYEVRVNGKTYKLDYAYPKWKVYVEWYGLPFHIGASAVSYDNDRITDMSGIGWAPVVFTDGASPKRIVDGIRAALTERGFGR